MLDAGRDVKTNQNLTLQKQAENSLVSPPPSLGTVATPITPHLTVSSSAPPPVWAALCTPPLARSLSFIIVIIVIDSMIVRCS